MVDHTEAVNPDAESQTPISDELETEREHQDEQPSTSKRDLVRDVIDDATRAGLSRQDFVDRVAEKVADLYEQE